MNDLKYGGTGTHETLSREPIDPSIVNIVRELNQEGFITKFSCAGHTERNDKYGFISFIELSEDDRSKVTSIAKHHGLKNIKFGWDSEDSPQITFQPTS